ncbi:MAG: HAMP domain-containing protein [Bacilli bacterium]|nr:HAMP domain-containing protein [Bacilli bacterium]
MKSKSLILKIFIYLSIFSFLILFLIWILQILLLNKYYEYYKTNELTNTLNLIKKNFNKENFSSVLENVAYNTDFCVEITSGTETIYSNIQNNKGCIDSNSNTKVLKKKLDFLNSSKEYFKLKIINPKFNNMTLLYGVKLDNNNSIFLNTSLEPIDTTIDVLKNQLIFVSVIVVILSVLIAYFISRSLSKPITKLTSSARELSNGNYNVDFNVSSDILEIEELGNTLDYTKNV